MLVGVCEKCKYTDLVENTIGVCPRCGANIISLGINSAQWNKMSYPDRDSLIEGRFPKQAQNAVEAPVQEPAAESDPEHIAVEVSAPELVTESVHEQPQESEPAENHPPVVSTEESASNIAKELKASEKPAAELNPEVMRELAAEITNRPVAEAYERKAVEVNEEQEHAESEEAVLGTSEEPVSEETVAETPKEPVFESTEEQPQEPARVNEANTGLEEDFNRIREQQHSNIYVCYKCDNIASHNEGMEKYYCPECGGDMMWTGFTTEEWGKLSIRAKRNATENAKIRYIESKIKKNEFNG